MTFRHVENCNIRQDKGIFSLNFIILPYMDQRTRMEDRRYRHHSACGTILPVNQAPPPYRVKVVSENCFECLEMEATVLKSFVWLLVAFIIMICYDLYRTKQAYPLPPLSLHCKDREFPSNFDVVPKVLFPSSHLQQLQDG